MSFDISGLDKPDHTHGKCSSCVTTLRVIALISTNSLHRLSILESNVMQIIHWVCFLSLIIFFSENPIMGISVWVLEYGLINKTLSVWLSLRKHTLWVSQITLLIKTTNSSCIKKTEIVLWRRKISILQCSLDKRKVRIQSTISKPVGD